MNKHSSNQDAFSLSQLKKIFNTSLTICCILYLSNPENNTTLIPSFHAL